MKSRYDGLDIYNVVNKDGQVRRCIATRFLDRELIEYNNRIHVVKYGENLMDIAFQYYGDITLWYIIAEKNQDIYDPFNLTVGMELFVPIV